MTGRWRRRLPGGLLIWGLAHGGALAQPESGADVSVLIQPNIRPVARAGQPIDYMLVVGNAGPSVATGVRMSFSSANLTDVVVSGACSALPCVITTLGVGYNASIYVHASVASDAAFTLSAGVSPRQKDPNASNNTASATVAPPVTKPKQPVGTADVSLSILPVGKPLARAGQGVDHRLVLSNAGPSVATRVSVRFKSANLTGLQVSGACSALPCTIGALGVGAKAGVLVRQTVVADRPFSLAAGVSSSQTDPNLSNNAADVTVAPPPPPQEQGHGTADVSLSLQPDSVPRARAGRRVDYRLVVANAGPSVARGVAVSFKSANLADPQVSGDCARLPCTIRTLAAGATASISLRQTVVADGPFSLTAKAVASETDPDPANNTDGVTVDPPPGSWNGQRLWWLSMIGSGLLALGLGTAAILRAQRRGRWLRQLKVQAARGSEDAFTSGPLSFEAPSMGVTARCEPGETGPRGPVPVLKVVSDD